MYVNVSNRKKNYVKKMFELKVSKGSLIEYKRTYKSLMLSVVVTMTIHFFPCRRRNKRTHRRNNESNVCCCCCCFLYRFDTYNLT